MHQCHGIALFIAQANGFPNLKWWWLQIAELFHQQRLKMSWFLEAAKPKGRFSASAMGTRLNDDNAPVQPSGVVPKILATHTRSRSVNRRPAPLSSRHLSPLSGKWPDARYRRRNGNWTWDLTSSTSVMFLSLSLCFLFFSATPTK
ncbi:uncharacterized protein LOC130795549 [Actinidia eriantha]|uniref:uncharacterized protein LOC130795549 n=1 Tax=Actinidia eriantha TaxID=165200 RepID=UPI002588A3A5|nr:uncharacterized protein LOC130795549 [Actinidia eriantha]